MQSRLVIAALAFVSIGFSQSLPSYQSIKEVDGSGMDSVAGVGTDPQGNVYIAGSTSSQHFTVNNAVQPNIASSGLYRLTGSSWTGLGLSSCSALALDPKNPSTIYAISNAILQKSVNGGVSFAPTSLPSSVASSIAIEPGNDQIVFVASGDQGVLKSTDGGVTWTTANNGLPVSNGGQVSVYNLWIDPLNGSLLFANTSNGLARSADGAASWQPTTLQYGAQGISFDMSNAGIVYITSYGNTVFKSVDAGRSFTPLTLPTGVYSVVADPIQAGRLIGLGAGIYQSTDGGATWTQESTANVFALAADTINRVYYGALQGSGIVRISGNLQTVTPAGASLPTGSLNALAVVNGQVFEANYGSNDVFVTKLDPSGNVLYSTYLGGTGNDQAVSMAVDAGGNVFLTGTTTSADFPVSSGAYATSGSVFLTRLNPDGSLAYSTYFSGTTPAAVATDGSGSAWLLGVSYDEAPFPVTPGALATTFCCMGPGAFFGPPIIPDEATLTRFSPAGSSLTFSTYIPGSGLSDTFATPNLVDGLAVAPDGTAYVGALPGIFRIDSTGSTLLSSLTNAGLNPLAITFGPDGNLYIAGTPRDFQATAAAFESTLPPIPKLSDQSPATSATGIIRIDPTLKNILAATFFGSYAQVKAMTTDAAGNLYVAGATGPTGLPTRTPFAGGFANPTGFMSELSADLSTLLFSSYFGDTENFTVSGVGLGSNGTVWIGGATSQGNYSPPGSGNVWVNNLALARPPELRIDSVENAASLVDGPLSAGETIVINGAGFAGNAQLTIGGAAASPISVTPTTITVMVPAGVPSAAAAVEVQSGGASTNSVLMPVAPTSPGIFSQSGSGYGQGYILNKDGTLNSPANPATPGDPITIFANGVGPMTFTQCCAVTQYPVNVYIDTIYCDGVEASVSQVNGLPGSIYEITVYVPNPAVGSPNANPTVVLPALSGVFLQVNGVSSQPGIAISIAQ